MPGQKTINAFFTPVSKKRSSSEVWPGEDADRGDIKKLQSGEVWYCRLLPAWQGVTRPHIDIESLRMSRRNCTERGSGMSHNSTAWSVENINLLTSSGRIQRALLCASRLVPVA